VLILNRIKNQNLVEHINRVGQILYEKETRPAGERQAGGQE
jgi:hypothetical protein